MKLFTAGITIGAYLLVAFGVGIVFMHRLNQKDWAFIVNAAGRQRMLFQRMERDLLAYSSGIGREEQRQDFLKTAERFDNNLRAFLIGGELSTDRGVREIHPIEDEKARRVLLRVEELWLSFNRDINYYQSVSHFQAITGLATDIRKALDDVVQSLERLADHDINKLWLAILFLITLYILGGVTTWWIMNRKVISPLINLIGGLKAVSEGNLEQRIAPMGIGEMRQAIFDFNDMAWCLHETMEQLRQGEERYRALFEDSRDAIYIISRKGKVIDVNQSAQDLFGYTREEMIGLDGRETVVHYVDGYRLQQEIEQKGFVKDYEVKFRKKDGAEMDCLLTSTVLRAKDGGILGHQGIIRDITEKRKMEQELLKAQKLESIGVLAGGIAHDFNNILMAILGNIDLAKMCGDPDDPILEGLIDAERAALRAKDLTQQLLTFSRGGEPIKKITSIAGLIKESASFALGGSNVRCEFSIPDDPWPVEVDEGQISQVINNLIINADQAMPGGGIIKVRAENMALAEEHALPLKEGKYVKVSIEDQGVGIPEEHLPKIFDPYFTTKQDGSGLGLATCYSIINRHDGYIYVESKLGVGTIFYIYLPASQIEILTKKDMEESIIVGEGKILLMDDEVIVRAVIGKMLSNIGYDVEFARDGAEAIELYREAKESGQPFDVLIMDLTIPGGMGGKEAFEKLLEIDPGIKAIASSGYSDDPIMSNHEQYGFRAVLPKPYKVQELSRTLHEVIMGDRCLS